MSHKVSIIIPVYNQKKELLIRSYQSALAQDYQNIECIIVDDGSTDGTAEFCDELAKSHDGLTVLHQANMRQGAARNNGIKHATGDYIFFLDSDDWIEPNTISTLVNLIIKYQAQIAVCSCFKQDNEGVINKEDVTEEQVTVLSRFQAYESYVYDTKYCSHSPCDKLFAKSLFQDEWFAENTYYEDLASVYKFIAHADTIVYTNIPLYCYYDNLVSTMHKKFSEHEFDKVRIYHEISEYFLNMNKSEYLPFVVELDKLTMYTAIGYINGAYANPQTPKTLQCVRDTQEICKEIKHLPGWKLNILRRMIMIHPKLFYVFWKCINPTERGAQK